SYLSSLHPSSLLPPSRMFPLILNTAVFQASSEKNILKRLLEFAVCRVKDAIPLTALQVHLCPSSEAVGPWFKMKKLPSVQLT
uniref:Uncharacterized protein n=1 Tax=Falco tinnunculus TaxID=100819 RepID=A0A8C4V656_FALTI